MTTIFNPFIVSGKIPEEYFCDRRQETETLSRYVSSHENVVLMSQRRMGKSKLIDHCIDNGRFDECIPIVLDILHTTSLNELVQLLGTATFDAIASRSAKMLKMFTATLRSLSACFSYDAMTNAPTFDIRLGDISQPEYTLTEIFHALDKADKRCLVIIDEFQQITNYPEKNVEAILRHHVQNSANADFIFSGSQRRLMEEMFFSQKRPFFMSARTIQLAAIPLDVYCEFAVANFRRFDKDIAPEAVSLAYNTFMGVTLYLQRIMKEAFAVTPVGECCDADKVGELINCYIKENDTRLREQLAFVTQSQKALLYAIHGNSEPLKSITSARFVKSNRLKSPSAVQAAARKLLEFDLITRDENGYRISDPLLAIWLRSRRL